MPALHFLAEQGFPWFEILDGTALSEHFCRRFMTLGNMAPPAPRSDADILSRFALLSDGQRREGIRLSALYVNAEFINPKAWPTELALIEGLLRVSRGFDAPILCLGGGPPESADASHGPADYRAFSEALDEVGRRSNDLGIKTVYHPHLDTFVETREQLDRLMDTLDTRLVGLCIDPAHLAHTDSDPVAALRDYLPVVRYMHFKDTRVGASIKGLDRYTAFCELGAGVVDFEELTNTLLSAEYDGIVIVELDASQKTAEQSALESIAYLRNELSLTLTPRT
jgi:inosose dehydratase